MAIEREVKQVQRSTQPVDLKILDRVHKTLRGFEVNLKGDPDSADLRRLFSRIRDQRNSLSRILARFLPLVARLKADLVRIDRRIEAETNYVQHTQNGLRGAKNERERKGALGVMFEESMDQATEVKMDLIAVEAVLAHCRHVRDELRYAFEEASRSLSQIELEYRIETK